MIKQEAMDLISVIVPAYNAEDTITRCLDSILHNNGIGELFEIEIIVVDDGSKDSTYNLVSELSKKHSIIRLIKQENQGPSSARWNGIHNSKGKYLSFCDSDDWVERNWLMAMYSLIKKNNSDIAIIRAIYEGHIKSNIEYQSYSWEREEAIKTYLEHKKINGSFVVKMFKRELFEGLTIDRTMTHCEDDILLWQMLQKINKVVRAEIPTYHITIHEGSLTNSTFKKHRWISTKKYFDFIISDCEKKDFLKPFMPLAKTYRIWWYFALMKLMLRDAFIDRDSQQELQRVFREAGLSYITKLSTIIDKVLFMIAYINLPVLFTIYSKIKK